MNTIRSRTTDARTSTRGTGAHRAVPLPAVSGTAVVACLVPDAPPVTSTRDRELVTESPGACANADDLRVQDCSPRDCAATSLKIVYEKATSRPFST